MGDRPPSKTIEEREKRMINLAMDLAEQQLRDGTAPPSVINHYIRMGASSYALERKKLEVETELMEAKRDNLKAMEEQTELFRQAVEALRRYQGVGEDYD